ncbi:UNVERIFIED_ORG: hypothetical protein ABIC43_002235 [Variovorax guangxiensis]
MNQKNVVEKLIKHWSGQRYLQVSPGLLVQEIEEFERRNNVRIPIVLSDYLRFANGFVARNDEFDLEGADDEGFEFHALSKEHLISSGYFVFCAWPFGFIDYAICLDDSDENGVVVKLIDQSKGYFLAKDFSDFISLYLLNSDRLYAAGERVIFFRE